MRFAIVALLLAGCAVDAPATRYTCIAIYRCTGGEYLEAALAMPCALDDDDATAQAEATGITAALERCPDGAWASIRPLCSVYEPAESCDVPEP